ncbi:MAG: zinc transporter ZntB [Chromatiales bacterium 21-64-14]|nr:MAG: zinc transporter ZntB [Chromatiales bacterium 21-64-14]HQU15160.1 zinc transporter ZntB [Gammaproteobacteria bacterium]
MKHEDGLVAAYRLAANGTGQPVGWREIESWTPGNGLLWIHLDYTDTTARDWILERSGLDPVTAEALLAEETRPRSVVSGHGLLVILRGVNLNPGADPEDMVSIRLWIDGERIISVRRRRLAAVQDLRDAIAAGSGPRTAGDFLVTLADRLVTRMADAIGRIDETADDLEQEVLTASSHELRVKLAELRREVIALRRYLTPQRDALTRLQTEPVQWLDDSDRMRIREVADRTTRYVEDLDAVRDRAVVTHEELSSRLAEQVERRMYVLSLAAAVFLPLGFVTGLLGVNVGGLPGAQYSQGFAIVCVLLAAIFGLQLWTLRRKGWL